MHDLSTSDSNYLSLELEPKLEASAYARGALRGAFQGLPQRVTDKLLSVVSELVNNAVLHGPRRPVALTVWLDPKAGVIRGQVIDQGDPATSIPHIREVRKERGGGHGLRLVEAMTSDWWVVEGNTSVQFKIQLDGREP